VTSAESIPELSITVKVPDRLACYLDDSPGRTHDLTSAIASGIDELLKALGIPGSADVKIAMVLNRPLSEWMRVWVGGRLCRFSDELPARIAAIVDGQHVAQPPALRLDWPEQGTGESAPWPRVRELLARLTVEVVKLQPAVLLGDAQCRAYGERLRQGRPDLSSAFLEQAFLSQVLVGVLGLGISLADVHRVCEVLSGLEAADPVDARELLIAALSTDCVDLLVPERFETQLGTGDLSHEDDLLAFVARGLFDETGLVIPLLRRVPPTELSEGFFAFRINHVLTTPWKCLDEQQILVNEVASALSLTKDAEPTMNPATGLPAAIATLADKEDLEQRGYTTWTSAGHIILCLASVLRMRAGWFVHQDKVQAQLDTLETVAPTAVRAARARLSPSRLTALIRDLAADHVPLYHLPVLLERVIETPYAEFGIDRLSVLDDPVTALHYARVADDATALQAFVRTGLRREIADQLTAHSGTLVTYLLDPSVERLLKSPRTMDDDDAVVAAFREELQYLPLTVRVPAVLTADDIRPLLKDLLALTLPRISVVGYGDLPADLNIQPVARVQLPDRETSLEGSADAARV
jgi:FHIPEP family protein